MRFFRRKKAEDQIPAISLAANAPNGKKEPLLGGNRPEQVPADEPVMITAADAPAWTDIDGTRSGKINDPEEGDADEQPGDTTSNDTRLALLKLRAYRTLMLILGCGGAVTTVKLALWAALGAGSLTLMLLLGSSGTHVNIAFVGNSYFYVNDLPRLFEQVTGKHIFQDSCLHASGSILNILKTGNGMYYKWQTQNAMVGGVEYTTSSNDVVYLYDYGACSVPQLLTGQDNMLSYGNQYGHYVNDGTNPCIKDNNYLEYESSFNYSQKWNYVVIVDQSKRMCFDDAREEALMAFNYTYAPLLSRAGATPVLVQPHAFWSDAVNMTGLTDIPTFTSMIMTGAKIYKKFLDKHTKRGISTKIAPVGDAYLTVWEENEELWQKLFLADGIHPSGYGSYLYAMVLHGTIYGRAPPKSRVVTDNVQSLFSLARKLHVDESGIPSKKEALALWKVANKVAVNGYKPKSLKSVGKMNSLSDTADDEGDDQNVQNDDNINYEN